MGGAGFGARLQRVAVVVVLAALLGGLVALVTDPPEAEAAMPPGFTSTPVFTGLTLPTALAFSPDGKVYVGEKSGTIRVYPNASTNTGTLFKNLNSRVFNGWDRGLLGLAIDPRLGDGSGHDFVYALYTTDAPPGQTVPRWNDNCPSTPGPHADGCVVSGTLSRIPVNANGTAGTEQIIITNEWCQQFTSHSVGHIAFGPDGYLYVTGGEGASYNNADWGQFGGSRPNTPTPVNPCGDPPGRSGVANSAPTARGGAMRSQSVRRPAGEPRLLNGAMLRIDPDTGAGVPGNPLYSAANPSSNASRIVAYGLRNSYRFTYRPGTSEIWAGDVGWGDWEEINRLTTPTPSKPVNFGWPCYEDETKLAGYRDLAQCQTLYEDTVDPATAPYWAYEHYKPVNGNDTCALADGSAISGLEFYRGTRYPAQYRNALFFGDHARNCLFVMTAGANGLPDPSTTRTFIDDSDNPFPVDVEIEPRSGDIFYANIVEGTINRISYASSNRAPTASATASPTSGAAPLSVRLDASGSSDPDGDALTYSWDMDGNGSFGDATGVRPTVNYPNGGTFQARVMVSDPGGLTATSAAVTITVTTVSGPRNTTPPSVSGNPVVGRTLDASDGAWSGTPPISYTRRWQRCTSATSCADIPAATSDSYSPQLADEGRMLRVSVTAANAGGTSVATSALVGPVTGGAANTPPKPTISAPTAAFRWKAGDTVKFAGAATDAQDGSIPAARLSWNIVLGHCTVLGCHEHPLATRSGTGGSVSAPDHEAPSYIQLTLTATDAAGASASVTRRVDPLTGTITFETIPDGLGLAVGAEQSAATPFSQLWVVNSEVQLNAPTGQVLGGSGYAFLGWSDLGAATHRVRVQPGNTNFVAGYLKVCASPTYRSEVLADAPLLFWRLGESGGTTAGDNTANARTGTYTGGVELGQVGALRADANKSATFAGTDGRVSRAGLTGTAPTGISASFWMKSSDTSKDAPGVLSYATTASADEFLLRDPGALRVYVKGTRVDTGIALDDGIWHHVVVTWRSAGGELQVYKDGELAFSDTSVQAGAALTGNGTFVVGQDQDSVGGGFDPDQAYVGQLDEVALYPSVLTAGRVRAQHEAGASNGCINTAELPMRIAPFERATDPRFGSAFAG